MKLQLYLHLPKHAKLLLFPKHIVFDKTYVCHLSVCFLCVFPEVVIEEVCSSGMYDPRKAAQPSADPVHNIALKRRRKMQPFGVLALQTTRFEPTQVLETAHLPQNKNMLFHRRHFLYTHWRTQVSYQRVEDVEDAHRRTSHGGVFGEVQLDQNPQSQICMSSTLQRPLNIMVHSSGFARDVGSLSMEDGHLTSWRMAISRNASGVLVRFFRARRGRFLIFLGPSKQSKPIAQRDQSW